MPLPRLFQFWVYQFLVLCWQFFFSGSLVSKFSYFQLPSGMDLVRQSSTLALTALPLASIARYMRTEMVDVLSSDYIELLVPRETIVQKSS